MTGEDLAAREADLRRELRLEHAAPRPAAYRPGREPLSAADDDRHRRHLAAAVAGEDDYPDPAGSPGQRAAAGRAGGPGPVLRVVS